MYFSADCIPESKDNESLRRNDDQHFFGAFPANAPAN